MITIKINPKVADSDEMQLLSERTGIDVDAAFGKCIRVWAWFLENHKAKHSALLFFNFTTMYDGFAEEMIFCGLLTEKKGMVFLSNFAKSMTGRTRGAK